MTRADDVVGFIPTAGGLLCCDCAYAAGFDVDGESQGSPIFASTEGADEMACEECNEHLIESEEDTPSHSSLINSTQPIDDVEEHIIMAYKAALEATKNILTAEARLIRAVRQVRLRAMKSEEFVVDCIIEVDADNTQTARWIACRNLFRLMCGDEGVHMTVYSAKTVANDRVRMSDFDTENLGKFFIGGTTSSTDGHVYEGIPCITAVDVNDEKVHAPGHKHATLNIASLLESLDDDQIKPHVVWRTPEDELGRAVRAARGDRGEDD